MHLRLTVAISFAVFYLSFVITPICSNASELMSSLVFAAKKTQTASSLTFSQVLPYDVTPFHCYYDIWFQLSSYMGLQL